MRRILIVNDDGIDSEGLIFLKRELDTIGLVFIVAPDRERSATGHALTLSHPLRVREVSKNIFITDGTPSDCVNLGVLGLLPVRPDLIVAGINKSPNLGDDVTYSGTVSAAMEGTLLGISSFAISMASDCNLDFGFAAKIARKIAIFILEQGLPDSTFLNVNVPNLKEDEIRGIEITYQGKRIYGEELIKRTDPRGESYYWIGGGRPRGEITPGSDFAAIAEKKISITPLCLNLTNFRALQILKEWRLDSILK